METTWYNCDELNWQSKQEYFVKSSSILQSMIWTNTESTFEIVSPVHTSTTEI